MLCCARRLAGAAVWRCFLVYRSAAVDRGRGGTVALRGCFTTPSEPQWQASGGVPSESSNRQRGAAPTEPDVLTKAEGELVDAFACVERQRRAKGPVAVRELAAHMSPETLEYLGEAHDGLAGFCRARAGAKLPVMSSDGTFFWVKVRLCDGVTRVTLTQRSASDQPAPAALTRVKISSLACERAMAGMPWARPPRASASAQGQAADDYVRRCLCSTLPTGVLISVDSLQQRWRLPTATEAVARLLSLVKVLAQWRALSARPIPDAPGEQRLGGKGPSYPTTNFTTGQVSGVSAEQIEGLFLALARAGESAGDVRWDDQLALFCQDGRVSYAYLPPPPTQTASAVGQSMKEDGEGTSAAVPQLYDLHRMAAHLTVGKPTPVDVVVRNSAAFTSFHPLQIAVTFPDRVRLHVSPEVDQFSTDDRGLSGWTLQVQPSGYRKIVGLSYVLKEADTNLLIANSSLAHLTIDELEIAKTALRHSAEPLKRAKLRKRYVRELFRRHFPEGNPFIDGEVVAQFLYDRMEPNTWYTNTTLKDDFLPGGGKDTMHVGVNFFRKYPHLFILRYTHSTMVEVMRREQYMEDVEGDEAQEGQRLQWSDESLQLCLLSTMFEDADRNPEGHLNLALAFSVLPYYHRKAIKQRGSPLAFVKKFAEAHPSVFIPVEEEEGKYRLERSKGVALANELSLKVQQSPVDNPCLRQKEK